MNYDHKSFYISFSIRPPLPHIVLNICQWCSKFLSESKVVLWSVHILYPMLHYPIRFYSVSYFPARSLLIPSHVSPSPSLSYSLSPVYFIPAEYITSCYHHLLGIHKPGLCSTSRQRSIIGCVTMYCAIIFWCLEM